MIFCHFFKGLPMGIRHQFRPDFLSLEPRDQMDVAGIATAVGGLYSSPVFVAARAAVLGYQVGSKPSRERWPVYLEIAWAKLWPGAAAALAIGFVSRCSSRTWFEIRGAPSDE